jgi:hypothetical protein
MIGAIVLAPYLYLAVPPWLEATFLGLGMLTILQITLEPILPGHWMSWAVTLVLLGADAGTALAFGAPSPPFQLANNTVLAIAVIGAANLWVQSGMKARDATVLGAALVVYDFVATSFLSLMNDLIDRLAGLPFAPMITWASDGGQCLGVGLGDLLLAAVFPLVMRKAFGRRAGLLALGLGPATLTVMLVLLDLRVVRVTVPAMVALGPLMVAQYLFWARRVGAERTTWQYLQAEPRPRTEQTSHANLEFVTDVGTLEFPELESALRSYATNRIDFLEDIPPDGSHPAGYSRWSDARSKRISGREGTFAFRRHTSISWRIAESKNAPVAGQTRRRERCCAKCWDSALTGLAKESVSHTCQVCHIMWR